MKRQLITRVEKATKKDLQHLKEKLKSLDLRIEQNAEIMQKATIADFMELRSRNNELFYKKMATKDAISRIMNKKFSKPSPEIHYSVASVNPNNFKK